MWNFAEGNEVTLLMKCFCNRLFPGLMLAALLAPALLFAQESDQAATPTPGEDSPFSSAPAATPLQDSPFQVPTGPKASDDPFEPATGGATESPVSDPFASGEPAAPFASGEPADPFAKSGADQTITDPFANTTAPSADNPFSTSDPFAGSTQPQSEPFAAATPAMASGSPSWGTSVRGVYVLATQPGMQNYNQLQQLAADFAAAEFNGLFAEVRTPFGVAYASDFEKPLPFIQQGFTNPMVEIRPLLPKDGKIIAVVWLLPSYNSTTGRTPPDTNPLGRNPTLICSSLRGELVGPGNEMYIDPGNPEGVAYLQNLVLEINRVVKPDAFLFRGVRYPGKDWGYSQRAVQNFRSQVGGSGNPSADDPTWCAWRRAQLGNVLREIRSALHQTSPNVRVGVMVETSGRPPETWNEYVASATYGDRMQDWLSWCREGAVDDIALEVHERVGAEGQYLEDWTNFLTTNCGNATPEISLGGNLNFSSGITMQYNIVRTRGVGTILYHYDKPLRSHSRGFFASLPNLVFRNAPGQKIPGDPINGEKEPRRFARMAQPPPEVAMATPAATAFVNPLANKPLVFASPTPVPSRTPEPAVVPAAMVRQVTLVSGQKLEAKVLEVTPTSITLEPQNGAAMVIARSAIATIEPPL